MNKNIKWNDTNLYEIYNFFVTLRKILMVLIYLINVLLTKEDHIIINEAVWSNCETW